MLIRRKAIKFIEIFEFRYQFNEVKQLKKRIFNQFETYSNKFTKKHVNEEKGTENNRICARISEN